MNGGTGKSGDGSRVPAVAIPAGVRKTIENIKEIASNHSDEEVYAMLRECSMDPNETCQKLLLQDTFHEVRRKRDKKKEGGNRELVDPKNRPAAYGRVGKFSSRFVKDKAGKTAASLKENGAIIDITAEKGKTPAESVSPRKDAKASTSTPSLPTGQPNGPIIIDHPHPSHSRSPTVSNASLKAKESRPPVSNATANNNNKLKPNPSPPSDPTEKRGLDGPNPPTPAPGAGILAKPPSSSLLVAAVCASTSDPVLVPALDARSPRAAGTIRRPVGSQRNSGTSFTHRETTHAGSSAHARSSNGRPSSSSRSSSNSRPSSGYSSRASLPNGMQRGAPNKEWKPKSTNSIAAAQPSNIPVPTADSAPSSSEQVTVSVSAPDPKESRSMVTEAEGKLDELELSERQYVIIPNHLQVPESEKYGLSFGSFESSYCLVASSVNGPNMSEKSSELYDTETALSKQADVSAQENISSPQEVPSTIPVLDQPSAVRQVEESFSSIKTTSGSTGDADGTDMQTKDEDTTVGLQDNAQFSPAPYSSFGHANNALTVNQSQPLDVPETEPQQQQQQEGAVNHIPNSMVDHVLTDNRPQDLEVPETAQVMGHDGNAGSQPNATVQQPFDMSSNYYTQLYRPTSDSDGRFSPFLAPGAAIKYGNISVLTGQAGQISAEQGGNPVLLSSSGSSAVASPAGSIIPASIPVPQQPLPVFRHPVGALQLSHYPPNYLPYNQYISPFYVPPPALHPFLGNAAGTAFPQQAPAGGIYTTPPGTAGAAPAAPMRYPPVGGQYKPGVNTGALTNAGTANVYSAYGLSTIGYAGASPVTTGNSGENDEMAGAQFKENNLYITGQQNEASAMWIPAPGRDLSTLQAGSFYGLSPQGAAGQHLAFAPGPTGPTAQASPAAAAGPHAFAGIYPHTAAMAIPHHQLLQPPPHSVEMVGPTAAGVGPTASLYPPPPAPQRTPVNWAGGY
ncbi:Cell wall protein AWA1 isoform 1 [Rhynchospora pubera]|uniref:Cell wall protein AWA1 isoform 1 n=1 Tax=Rhynchospora pubera TaxID=906938 RepID=A0AAV8HE36_9POAL|nr:Cell wall protein AWA1 isoform 1 [Rhynchospora pubera]